MKLEHIRYFVETAQSSSISAAAKKLYVSQSTLSSAIGALEKELGCRLLARSSTGTGLTEEGQRALRLMSDIVEKEEELHSLRSSPGPAAKKNICVCIYPCLCSYLSIALSADQLCEKYPGVTLSVKDSVGIADAKNGSADILINHCEAEKLQYCGQILEDSGYAMEELFKDRLCLYAGSGSELAGRDSVQCAELSDMHLAVSQCCTSRHGLKEYQKISRNVTVLNHPDAVKQAVGDGGLIGIAPGCSFIGSAPRGDGRLVRVPVADFGKSLIVYSARRKNAVWPENLIIARIRELLTLA